MSEEGETYTYIANGPDELVNSRVSVYTLPICAPSFAEIG
jgi:hypothetical protein